MHRQTGPQQPSPIPGKKKNCNEWAVFEAAGSSPTAALCNGGWYDGSFYHECPVRAECVVATRQKAGKTHLPVTHQARPLIGAPRSFTVASTPNLGAQPPVQKSWADQFRARPPVPTTVPQVPMRAPEGLPTPATVPAPLPYPVAPPKEWPAAMTTPYAGPVAPPSVGITPTFLPGEEEDVFSRLLKNIAQGAVGSTGWHIFDYARTVDLFGRR